MTEKWPRARVTKFSVKQVASLTKPGVYSDGGGLYLRVRDAGRSCFFIGTYGGKRFELGLGPAIDVSLARARERADEIRTMLLDGMDPRIERARARAARNPSLTFGAFSKQLIDDIEDGFKNPKHRQQWRNTLGTYAKPIANRPISQVTTEDILAILQPIWLSKAETASRVRGRIERVLDAAKAKGLRSGENPARYRGHLELLLPKRPSAARPRSSIMRPCRLLISPHSWSICATGLPLRLGHWNLRFSLLPDLAKCAECVGMKSISTKNYGP